MINLAAFEGIIPGCCLCAELLRIVLLPGKASAPKVQTDVKLSLRSTTTLTWAAKWRIPSIHRTVSDTQQNATTDYTWQTETFFVVVILISIVRPYVLSVTNAHTITSLTAGSCLPCRPLMVIRCCPALARETIWLGFKTWTLWNFYVFVFVFIEDLKLQNLINNNT